MSTGILVLFGLSLALMIYTVSVYNGLVALKNRVSNAFAQIDVQLKRRYELIPNIVETAKGYMAHERQTLEAVVAARGRAVSAETRAASQPTDGSAMTELINAESALSQSLGKLFVLVENYPDLKANETMHAVMEELSSTENRVSFARQAYNDGVMDYNTKVESFPDGIVAGWFRFRKASAWADISPVERETVRVSFSK